jgi:hypothetical protein
MVQYNEPFVEELVSSNSLSHHRRIYSSLTSRRRRRSVILPFPSIQSKASKRISHSQKNKKKNATIVPVHPTAKRPIEDMAKTRKIPEEKQRREERS